MKVSYEDQIKKCAQNVYDALGSGHSESVYHMALEVEMRSNSLRYSSKPAFVLIYKGCSVGWCFPDIVYHTNLSDIVIELKATTYAPRLSEKAQLSSYLRARNLHTGFLINFPQPTTNRMTNEIDFIVLTKDESLIPDIPTMDI